MIEQFPTNILSYLFQFKYLDRNPNKKYKGRSLFFDRYVYTELRISADSSLFVEGICKTKSDSPSVFAPANRLENSTANFIISSSDKLLLMKSHLRAAITWFCLVLVSLPMFIYSIHALFMLKLW